MSGAPGLACGAMTSSAGFLVVPIGRVVSELVSLADAPKQGDEGDCVAWIELRADVAVGLRGVEVGSESIVLTWLHLARRDVLEVHPRGDQSRALTGVFATRSPHRPNPIGLHRVTVLDRRGDALRVSGLEAVDGTPVLDIKSIVGPASER
jgi:tRNA-Thr(GGU) m(6)t(6)A37 methyltransferase TsaA